MVFTFAAQAAQGDRLGRARVINVNPDASSSALNPDVDDKTTLELDFSYFVVNNLALELILATTRHDVTAGACPGWQRQGPAADPHPAVSFHV